MSAIINQTGRLDSPITPRYSSCMTREKFERKEAERRGVTVEHLREYHEITPCDCGKPKCKGWKVRWKFGAERRREGRTA